MRVEFSETAAAEIEAVADYFTSIGEQTAGANIIADIYEAADRVGRSPFMGHRQEVADVRKVVVRGTSYILYYLIDELSDEIVILSVQHAARGTRPFDDI